jgi:hypothetical protein
VSFSTSAYSIGGYKSVFRLFQGIAGALTVAGGAGIAKNHFIIILIFFFLSVKISLPIKYKYRYIQIHRDILTMILTYLQALPVKR